MASQTNPDNELELSEIEIYTPLMPQDLADILTHPDSPLYIEKENDDGEVDIFFCLKEGVEDIVGSGMIEEYHSDRDLYKGFHYRIRETMKEEPKSSMWTDGNVDEAGLFIPTFKPIIDYLISEGIEFCVIGRDEESRASLIGHHKDGKTVIDKDFKYDHKKILE